MADTRWRDDPKYREWKRQANIRTHLSAEYGISLEEYQAMLAKQNGACAICKKTWKRNLYVDHDHETGKVRALLCHKCNHLIGLIEEEGMRLESVICYLKQHKSSIFLDSYVS